MNLPLRFGALLLAVALLAGGASAADSKSTCDRACLGGFVTRYLNALVSHDAADLPVADNLRFTEDTVESKLGATELWRDASRIRDYRLDILDPREGTAAAQVVLEESGKPVMLVVRLKISDGRIAELETQITRSKAEGSIFNPDALKSPGAEMLATPAESQRDSREEMIRIAGLYPAGLKAGSFLTVNTPFAPRAYRLENGNLMAGPGCTFMAGCVDIQGQHIPTLAGIRYRVAAVDEEQGIVLLRMDFGSGSSFVKGDSLMVWEAFKVYGGQIHAVEAFMKNMPLGTPSGWDSSAAQ